MKIGTFTEARRSLVGRFRKNVLGHRGIMIALWCQLALIVGIACVYLVIRVSLGQVKAHPNQSASASMDMLSVVSRTGFGIFVIGLPVLILALGICGILPGTHRKKSL
jgi:hypothetical protein